MKEVDSIDEDKDKKYPLYPLDMIEKLWDDYHLMRDNQLSGHVPLDFKDGKTRQEKLIMLK
jgi:hypothetical protein